MDFEKVCMKFAMDESVYGIILSSMRKLPEKPEVLPTIGVSRSGNVFVLGYNPEYVEHRTTEELTTLLKHEMLHLCFYHLTMWDDAGMRISNDIKTLRNIAMDLEVNSYLDKAIIKQLGGQLCEDWGFPEKLGAREYFKRLLQMYQQHQQQQAQNPQKPCNGGQGGNQEQQYSNSNQQSQQNQQNQVNDDFNSNQNSDQQSQGNIAGFGNGFGNGKPESVDDHSQWPTDIMESSLNEIEQSIDDLIMNAAEETEKSHGELPGELKLKVKKLRKKPRPITDWRRYFRRFCGNEFSELIRKSKKRESKRFPDTAGNRHQRKSHILVGIDTSGSINMYEYKEFMGQIKTLSEKATFHIVECDYTIQHEYDYNGKFTEIFHGGGGTSFQPVVDLFHKNKRKYDALVYFTDGYAPIPRNTPKETLWVISSDGDQTRNKYKVNGATSVFIPERIASQSR